jgi:hypothetical protein
MHQYLYHKERFKLIGVFGLVDLAALCAAHLTSLCVCIQLVVSRRRWVSSTVLCIYETLTYFGWFV